MELVHALRGPELRLRVLGQLRRRYGKFRERRQEETLKVVMALVLTPALTQGLLPKCAQALELGCLRPGQYKQGHLASKVAPDYSGQGLAQAQNCPRSWDGLGEFRNFAHLPDLGWHWAHGAEGNAQVTRLQWRAARLGVRLSQMRGKAISTKHAPFRWFS